MSISLLKTPHLKLFPLKSLCNFALIDAPQCTDTIQKMVQPLFAQFANWQRPSPQEWGTICTKPIPATPPQSSNISPLDLESNGESPDTLPDILSLLQLFRTQVQHEAHTVSAQIHFIHSKMIPHFKRLQEEHAQSIIELQDIIKNLATAPTLIKTPAFWLCKQTLSIIKPRCMTDIAHYRQVLETIRSESLSFAAQNACPGTRGWIRVLTALVDREANNLNKYEALRVSQYNRLLSFMEGGDKKSAPR